jgi:hypothetical protein
LIYELGQVLLFDADGSLHLQEMGQHDNPVRQEARLICRAGTGLRCHLNNILPRGANDREQLLLKKLTFGSAAAPPTKSATTAVMAGSPPNRSYTKFSTAFCCPQALVTAPVARSLFHDLAFFLGVPATRVGNQSDTTGFYCTVAAS